MKKTFPFLVGFLILSLLALLIISSTRKPARVFDERITLRQRDKIPYGTKVARGLLPDLFRNAAVSYSNDYPGLWDSISRKKSGQAVVLIAEDFDADKEELSNLVQFVSEGNYVFITAKNFSDVSERFFGFRESSLQFTSSQVLKTDSLQVRLLPPAFIGDTTFMYPGSTYESQFYRVDTATTAVLGQSANGAVNFIQLNKGKGKIFLHSAPLAFSNYFILHKNNSAYYEAALSVIPPNVTRVLWNEYYLDKPYQSTKSDEPNWLKALMAQPSFNWGLLTALVTLLLFVLLGVRRRQRMIPPYGKPKNDSLDFVKTLGRLYYDQRDHRNLALKLSAYFLEHIRAVYKLPTHTLDAAFVQALHHKSGFAEDELKQIFDTIIELKEIPFITETELARFYKRLDSFYQTT